MTIKEILNKAVAQALANGWDIFDEQRDKRAAWPPTPENVVVTESSDGRQGWDLFIAVPHIYEPIADRWEAEDLLFNIPFAKALWGEEEVNWWDTHSAPIWVWRLEHLAVSEDRFKYLEENL